MEESIAKFAGGFLADRFGDVAVEFDPEDGAVALVVLHDRVLRLFREGGDGVDLYLDFIKKSVDGIVFLRLNGDGCLALTADRANV